MDQDLFFNSIEIIIAVIILLFFGAIISVILRRPILEGIATGLLFAASSCGVSFYISFEFALPLWFFLGLSFLLLSLMILGMRKFIFKSPFQGRVGKIAGEFDLMTEDRETRRSLFSRELVSTRGATKSRRARPAPAAARARN